jgi:hypothetical protein
MSMLRAGLKYEDELMDELKQLTDPNGKPEKPLRKVGPLSGRKRSLAMFLFTEVLPKSGTNPKGVDLIAQAWIHLH